MTEQSNAELIAEARDYAGLDEYAGATLLREVAERLEAADQRAELAEANLSVEESKNAGYRAKNNQLAAVVEKVRETLAGMAKRYTDNSDAAYFTRSIEAILATAPADALAEHDAALVEGLATEAGYSLVHHKEAVAFLRREARQRREEQDHG